MSEDTVQRLMGLASRWCDVERRHCIGRAEVFDIVEARRTLESALREALVPAGWKLVPEVPTKVMLHAGSAAADGFGTPLTRTGLAYRAMLSAAPSAFPVEPEQPEQGVSPQAGPRSPSQAHPIADAAQRALKVSEFPAVKEARLAASAQMQFYRDMMAAAALREGSNHG